MDRQCIRSMYEKLWIFHSRRTRVSRHDRRCYIFYDICALAIHWLFQSEKNDHDTVSPRREASGKHDKRGSWTLPCQKSTGKTSKGNYERYKFLTSVYFSFMRFGRAESIVKSETNTRPFFRQPLGVHLLRSPRNDLKTFHLFIVACFSLK